MKNIHPKYGFKTLFKKFAFIDFQGGRKLRNGVERQVLFSAFYLLVVPVVEPMLGHIFLGQSAFFPQALDIACDPSQKPIVSRTTHVLSFEDTTSK